MTHSAFTIEGADRDSRWLVTCDHASNHVPDFVNDRSLGLPDTDMQRHIAYDVGALGVARELADNLLSPLVFSGFSRLVIDPNRGLDDPTLVMRLYDGSIIPANCHITPAQVNARIKACYQPYHDAVAKLATRHNDTIYVAVHSFTAQLNGYEKRPWHIGILFADDERLSRPLLDLLHAEPDLCVGENEPYGGHLPGDSVDRHALSLRRPNILIEIRNDLISLPEQQKAWGRRLAPLLKKAAEIAGV